MLDDKLIKTFLIKECAVAFNPRDNSDTYMFSCPEELIDVLFLVLRSKSAENSLLDLQNKILKSIQLFSSSNIESDRLNSGLDTLTVGFEGLLKRIAEIKYDSEPVKFYGDQNDYKGLLHSSLGNLLEGKVAKINVRDNSIPQLSAPIVTFSYSSPFIRDVIYNHIRNLRNEIHLAPERPLSKIMSSFRDCISAYLFAIEENIVVIRLSLDPVFWYLTNAKSEFLKTEEYFINIDTEETSYTTLPELDAIEWQEGDRAINSPKSTEGLLKKVPITSVLKNSKSIWLIGEPGSGKTTSFQMSALSDIKSILNSGLIGTNKIPILIEARIIKGESIKEHVKFLLKIDDKELDILLIKDKLKILIDGINEVSDGLQHSIQNELRILCKEYQELYVAISSRRYGFTKNLDIPVFELLPLSLDQIENYIRKYVRKSDDANNLISQLRQADELIMDFAKNPMLLRMLIHVGVKEHIQSNFGLLFEKFINWILEREKKKSPQTDKILKEKLLANVGFNMRLKSQRVIDQDELLSLLKEAILKWNETVSAIGFYDEVLDNMIIQKKGEKDVMFFHELVLEYYAAVQLKEIYLYDPKYVVSFADNVEWHESLIILSGILINPDDLVLQISYKKIDLAARCIASGSKVSSIIVNAIFMNCENRLLKEDQEESETITALLELASQDSFRLVVKHLAFKRHSFTAAISRCQRPEVVAIKLLNFGLTGKSRIRQCLKVFVGKPNSTTFINSETIGTAQDILISGKVEVEDLYLIDELGVSTGRYDRIRARIRRIILESDLQSKIFAKACELFNNQMSSDTELLNDINQKIREKLGACDTGSELYQALRILQSIHKRIDVTDVIASLIDKIFEKKYYQLLLMYLQGLEASVRNIEKYIEAAIIQIVEQGKLSIINAYQKYYGEFIAEQMLINAFRNRIEIGFINDVFLFLKESKIGLSTDDIMNLRNCFLRMKILPMGISSLVKWCNVLKLHSVFQDLAIITTVHDMYGFARRIDNGEFYYFKKASAANRLYESVVGKIIKIDGVKIPYGDDLSNRRPSIKKFHLFY